MRKLLVGLALSLVATAASAEWAFVQTTIGIMFYADPTTKNRTRNVVRMWDLKEYGKPQVQDVQPYSSVRSYQQAGHAIPQRDLNFVKPQVQDKNTYYSVRSYQQYDCVERTMQSLQMTAFEGSMGTGEALGSDNKLGDKQFIASGTVGEALLNYACK